MNDPSYRGLIKIPRYLDRFEYLKIGGSIGAETFGWAREMNQSFYRSMEWRRIRDSVILRDEGMDMAFEGRPIFGKVIVHHIQPLTIQHFESDSSLIYDTDNLVCVSHKTHNAIHYGDAKLLAHPMKERRPGDTKLW